MSKWCPVIQKKVLYLDCLEREDRTQCGKIPESSLEEKNAEERQEYKAAPFAHETYRVIIAGSRKMKTDAQGYNKIRDAMIELVRKGYIPYQKIKDVEIISGGCPTGTDVLGEMFAERNNITVTRFPAEWKKYGKYAGPKRNKDMAEYASKSNGFLLAFWDGKSKGTRSMVQEAQNCGLKVFTYELGQDDF